ncbi:MAG TPA: hypothetical protein DC057_08790 [Spirochaetia bacterium]|nr:hypothetical protein [Spirochaetia bacterium]
MKWIFLILVTRNGWCKLVWVLRRESGWGLEIVLINGGTIPETYLKDKQIKNISEKTDKLILITHDKDYIKYDQTGEKNSKSLLDRKNNKDRKYNRYCDRGIQKLCR